MNIVKKVLLAVVVWAGVGFGSAAVAADLTASTPPSWTGFYAGANVGYGWDSGSVKSSMRATDPTLDGLVAALLAAGSLPRSLSPSVHGFIGGGQIGYNWRLSDGWLLGAETDLQASGIDGSTTAARNPVQFDPTLTTVTKKIGWFGTVRGRVGYLITPQWLLYATAGLAYGDTTIKFSTFDVTGCVVGGTICADGSSSSTRVGWTVGGGVEAMLTQNWSVKAEYLYVDLGKKSANIASFTSPIVFRSSAHFHEQIVRVGLNYHFE
ncbi:outer-membrane immunogenic protein [Labrys miyagiensis]|uniref:Outer-membrane immunogenic protein n=1 Tax=Labrys miyagiensis TaxID=346912 RepID=A0ABQ6CKL0_9HYPH|nr:outer membrane protein [Labrys miyagiensis]GLS20284.1 outer-membrane immunogenic protein [Labrys miyagiensis]